MSASTAMIALSIKTMLALFDIELIISEIKTSRNLHDGETDVFDDFNFHNGYESKDDGNDSLDQGNDNGDDSFQRELDIDMGINRRNDVGDELDDDALN
jgi:hypothetical protein